MLTMTSVVSQISDVLGNEIDNEVVLLSFETGKYYGMEAIASHIWQLIATPRSVESVCAALMNDYEVDAETCQRDVLGFLNHLESERLIVVAS